MSLRYARQRPKKIKWDNRALVYLPRSTTFSSLMVTGVISKRSSDCSCPSAILLTWQQQVQKSLRRSKKDLRFNYTTLCTVLSSWTTACQTRMGWRWPKMSENYYVTKVNTLKSMIKASLVTLQLRWRLHHRATYTAARPIKAPCSGNRS